MIDRKKLWLKLGVSLLVVGLVLSGVGFAMGGFDELKSTVEVRAGTYDAGDVSALRIMAISANVRVEKADGDQVEVTYFEGAREGVEVMLEDGVLTMKQYNHLNWRDYLHISWGDREIVVRVPGELATAALSSTSGKVALKGVPVTGDVSIGSTSGRIEATGSAGSLALSTTSGGIDAHDMAIAGDVTAGTTSGKTTLSGLTAGGALKAGSTSGSISVTDVDAQGFTIRSVSGSVHLSGANADAGEGAISATTTSGRIEVSSVSAAAFSFRTVSGAVTGVLPGSVQDYTITTNTVSGGNSLPEKSYGGPKTIDVSTTSGGIKLSFEE